MMRQSQLRYGLCAFLAAIAGGLGCANAQEQVTFPSLDGKTTLNAYLAGRADGNPRPALVLLHGCGGLQASGKMFPVYRAWGQILAAKGYVTLTVDSAGSRGFGQTCTGSAARRTVLADRPKDAYAALQYLQAQPFVRPDRAGVVGWSQGGRTVLLAIRSDSTARPPALAHDFRAAVAFYPGGCSERLQSRPFVDAEPRTWASAVPLLVLLGGADNWTPPAPCETFIAGAKARGASIEMKLYPGAYHVFDAPNLARRELSDYRLPNGTVPIVATDRNARADALVRVPEFLRQYLEP
jgi:dienelactone hydrolase